MIDLVHRANQIRAELEMPAKEFMVFILAPGYKAFNELRSGLQWGLGTKMHSANITIEHIDLDSKDLRIVRGISAIHCITKPEYMELAPAWMQQGIRNCLATSALALKMPVEELITGPEVFKEEKK